MKAKAAERKTLGVLVDYMNLFAGGYETEFRQLFEAICRRRDLNLMFVYGRSIAHPDPGYAAHNRIYELLGPRRIDGLIALSSSLTSFCGVEGASTFFKRYRSLALCSIGLAVPSVPSLEIDNRAGMEALLDHMIAGHGYRRLAFLAGPARNAEAQVRFQAYRESLARHGLPFDPQLVEEGDFARRSGNLAISKILARAAKPDAVISANDGMALGAITALRSLGFQVPRDIAVSGFDDLAIARLGDPPLTTVCQPIEAMAEHAVELVMEQIEGRVVPEVTWFPTRFVSRESCGCQQNLLSSPQRSDQPTRAATAAQIAARAAELSHAGQREQPRSTEATDIARLAAALQAEFSGHPDAFMAELEGVLVEVGTNNERYQNLQNVITRLRREFTELATPQLEDLWHRGRSVIALTNTRRQEQLRLEHDQAYHRLIDNGERFAAALDLPTLKSALSGALLTLGMDHAYVSHYPAAEQRELECVVAIREGVAYQPATPRFPAEELMPLNVYPEARRSTFLVFPLAFDAQNLGVAVFEAQPGVNGYQIVRDQISAVLRSIELHQEILQQTTLHERRIQEQERQATAKRIQSLSVLAGGVAHDLNNVLGPLVALPDLITEQLEQLVAPQNASAIDLRADVQTIKVAALRAAQTIKDLLTLGRQGRMAKEPLELNEVVSRCLTADGLRLSRDPDRVSIALSTESLFVLASEAHLTRAVTNLVRNAIEATDGHGQVVVKTGSAVLREPTPGYETIDPGTYAMIVVSDTGRGISPHEIGRVFEPFFSSKRLSDHCGSGLGLAIVHGVVKEHGGFVNVESIVGQGTTFTLYLPRTLEARAFSTTLVETPRGSANILVVDDEPVQLRTCRRVLTSLGYRVDTLSSGNEAYRLFFTASAQPLAGLAGKSPYDLVILDMLLNEEEDGLLLFNRIRALFPGQRGIVASGHAPSQRVELAVEHGLTWLAKPYTRATLARAVHGTLTTQLPRESSRASSRRPLPNRPSTLRPRGSRPPKT